MNEIWHEDAEKFGCAVHKRHGFHDVAVTEKFVLGRNDRRHERDTRRHQAHFECTIKGQVEIANPVWLDAWLLEL